MTWLLDLDGVVWRGDTPIPGSIEAILVRGGEDRSHSTSAQYSLYPITVPQHVAQGKRTRLR